MTKGETVTSALNEIGIADYEFDVSAEELDSGIKTLDRMMARWSAKGVKVFYPFSSSSEASDESGIPDTAVEAVVTNLAIRLAPSYGKTVPQEVRTIAKQALSDLMSFSTRPREMQFPSMPKGAGYKNTEWPFTEPPEGEYVDEVDNDVDLSGGYNGR